MKKAICIVIAIMCLLLAGCSIPKYTEQDYNSAKDSAYQRGYDEGYEVGKDEGYDEGYQSGKSDGYEDAQSAQAEGNDNQLSQIPIEDYYAGPGSENVGVYTTPSGSKYHKAGCQYVDGRHDLIRYNNASAAKSAGYDACSVCF